MTLLDEPDLQLDEMTLLEVATGVSGSDRDLQPAAGGAGRVGVCTGCGEHFTYPNTGPARLFCSRLCRDRRHARAAWESLQRRRALGIAEPDGLVELGLDLPPRIVPTRPSDDFGLRFRGHDEVAWKYETVLLGDPCSYCDNVAEPTVTKGGRKVQPDHIVPFSQGGKGEWENLTAACRQCNASKNDLPLLLWLLGSPRLSAMRAAKLQMSLDLDVGEHRG